MKSNPERSVENHVRQVSEMVSVDKELDTFLDAHDIGPGTVGYEFIKSHTQQIALEARIDQTWKFSDYIQDWSQLDTKACFQTSSARDAALAELESQLKSKEEP